MNLKFNKSMTDDINATTTSIYTYIYRALYTAAMSIKKPTSSIAVGLKIYIFYSSKPNSPICRQASSSHKLMH